MSSTTWQERAACSDLDKPEYFFPGKDESPEEALRICAPCPVRIECLVFASRMGHWHGIWGGVTHLRALSN